VHTYFVSVSKPGLCADDEQIFDLRQEKQGQ